MPVLQIERGLSKMNQKTVKMLAIRIIEEKGLINLTRSELCSRARIKEQDFNVIMECTFTEFLKEIIDSVKTPGRKNPILKKAHILQSAIEVAYQTEYLYLTRDAIAEQAGVSSSLIAHHFGTMSNFFKELMQVSIKNKEWRIVAQGLNHGNPTALAAPAKIKREALRKYPHG